MSRGAHFSSYVQANCWDNTPDLQKPLVSALMRQGNEACATLVHMSQSQFKQSLDPMFSWIEAGTQQVQTSLTPSNFTMKPLTPARYPNFVWTRWVMY